VADQQLDNKKRTGEAACYPKDRSRRSALKKLAIGAGLLTGYQVLPKQWTKPLIEQVVLPAHAQTSSVSASLTDPCESVTLVSGNQSSTTVIINVEGYVSPATANVTINIEATITGGTGETTTNSTTTDENGNYSLEMVVNGGSGITSVSVVITAAGATGSANCSVSVPDVSSAPQCGGDGYPIKITNNSTHNITISENPWTSNNNLIIQNNEERGFCLQITYIACSGTEYTSSGFLDSQAQISSERSFIEPMKFIIIDDVPCN